MLSDNFRLYVDETVAFVRSFVYKVDIQNDLLNARLQALGYDVLDDETSWKYHLNLNGQYHEADVTMTVISSDTKEEITFDKATLALHPRTKLNHQRGKEDYSALVGRYPNQETLINGIVNPVELTAAITASNFEIMSFDGSYLQDNERTLMRRIQEWIDIYISRWWVPQLAFTNNLYPADFVAKLNMLLVGAVLTIRMELSTGDEASDFHLWSYLSGHYGLESYKANLTMKQALWLFKNISYLRRNAGTIENLESMIVNLLVPTGLALETLDFLQLDDTLLTNLTRDIAFSMSNYGATQYSLASGDRLTPNTANKLLIDKAPYNAEDLDIELAHLEERGVVVKQNRLATKVMRASEDGSLLSQEISNMAVKVNYWAYLSYLDLYTPTFTIETAALGTLYLTAKEAFVFYMYAANRTFNNVLVEIPEITVKGVLSPTIPLASELLALTDAPEITIQSVQEIIDGRPTLTNINTLDDFVTLIETIIERDTIWDMLEEGYAHPDTRAMMRDVSDGLIADVTIRLYPEGTLYTDWIYDIGVNDVSISASDWMDVCTAITSAVIDYSGNTTSVGRRQRAIIEIVNMLTSYDVHLIAGNNATRRRVINFHNERFFDFNVEFQVDDFITYGDRVLDDSIGNIGIAVGGEVEAGDIVDLPAYEPWTAEVDYGTDVVDLTIEEPILAAIDDLTDHLTIENIN